MAQVKTEHQFQRAARYGGDDVAERIPELFPLCEKKVAVFGLGCVGAPSAIELARAGVGHIAILDSDFVDPPTTTRWPLGISAAGLNKVDVISDFIRRNYPYTKVTQYLHRLGAARLGHPTDRSDHQVLREMLQTTDLIYDATAEFGVQHVLSEHAWQMKIPYVSVDATQGGWGGRVFRSKPNGVAGCWICFQKALTEGRIEPPPYNPAGSVQPQGCGDPTFTGAGFDLLQVALTGVRIAVSTLCDGVPDAYPAISWDAMVMGFRDKHGSLISPQFTTFVLPRDPVCPRCGDVS